MAYLETRIKLWTSDFGWVEGSVFLKGDVIHIYEQHNGSGRWLLKQVYGMSEFLLLKDAKLDEKLVGVWLNETGFDLITKERGN